MSQQKNSAYTKINHFDLSAFIMQYAQKVFVVFAKMFLCSAGLNSTIKFDRHLRQSETAIFGA